jgi:hypothetical protein
MVYWSRRGWIRTSLLAVCLLVGGVILGSLLGAAPARASAATYTAAPPPSKAGTYCRTYEQSLASNLHISVSTLQSANRSALRTTIERAYNDHQISKTQENNLLNKLASAKDPCTVVDQAVAIHNWYRAAHTAVANAVATKLGIQPSTLEANLASGQTLVQIAASRGVSINDINTTYLDAVQAQITSAEREGILTNAQATNILAKVRRAVAQGRYPLVEPHAMHGEMNGGMNGGMQG